MLITLELLEIELWLLLTVNRKSWLLFPLVSSDSTLNYSFKVKLNFEFQNKKFNFFKNKNKKYERGFNGYAPNIFSILMNLKREPHKACKF